MKNATIFILFVIQTLANAQNFIYFDIDTTAFPTVKAKYFAFDANGDQVLNSSVNDFEIREDGILKTVTGVNCPAPHAPEILSSVLTIDVSGSMGSYNRMNIAKTAAKAWVELLLIASGYCAVTSFDNWNYLNQDFTSDKTKLYNAIEKLSPNGGTDYNAGFTNEPSGALKISKKGKNKKVILFLTDGSTSSPINENNIIADANSQNCAVYSVVLGMDCPANLKKISEQTGGLWFENITTEEEAKYVYKMILYTALSSEPCTVEWQSDIKCTAGDIDLKIKYKPFNIENSRKYYPSKKSIAKLSATPASIYFNGIYPGMTKDTTITVTAVNSNFNVTNVTSSNPAFTIDKTNFYLSKGKSIDLKITFTPNDSNYTFTKFIFENDICTSLYYSIGLATAKIPGKKTLKLTHPNGGEEFAVGSDTVITWEGISEADTVKLEFSNNKGNNWQTITDCAIGLKYNWKNIPAPASNNCLIKIKQYMQGHSSDKVSPTIEWQKTYGGTNTEGVSEIHQTVDGGFIVGGSTNSNDGDIITNKGKNDFLLLKLNSIGEIEWIKTYGGSSEDYITSLEPTKDFGYIVAGMSSSIDGDFTGNNGGTDCQILKLNSLGEIEWQKNYGGNNIDKVSSIKQTKDGGYIVTGSNFGKNNGTFDAWVFKIKSNGDLEWENKYGGTDMDLSYSIQQTKDGGYIFAGNTESYNGDVTELKGETDFWVVKLNKNGKILWQKTYGGSDAEVALSIQQTNDGGYIVGGITESINGDVTGHKGYYDYWVVKIDAQGTIEWQKTYGGYNYEYFSSIRQTSEGGYIISGYSNSYDFDVTDNKGNFDYWILKINTIGDIEWAKTFGGTNMDNANFIEQTSDGGFIAVGGTHSKDVDVSDNKGETDIWVVKINLEGKVLQDDISDSLFAVVEPKAAADDIDMKKCLVGKTKDSLIAPFIYNGGLYKCRIDSIYFTGSDADCFSIINGFPKYELTPSASHPTELCFKPNRVGIHSANIVIVTQSGIIIKKIIGEGVIVKFSPYSQIIDFGVVELGESKDTLDCLTIKNLSSLPVEIKKTKHNKPNDADFTTISGGGSFTLQPDETRKMDLRFTPTSVGRTNGTLEFYYDGEGGPLVIQLFGQAEQCNGLSANYSSSDEQSLFMDSLVFGNTNCKYLTFTNKTDERILIDEVYLKKNTDFSVPLSQFPLIINASDSVRLQICFSPLQLGKSTDTLVYSDLCEDKSITLSGFCKPNIYQALSNCNTEITLQTKKGNALKVFMPSPNPFSESTALNYYCSSAASANIDIYNIYGEKITQFSRQSAAGMNSLEIKLEQNIANGTYFCVMKIEDATLNFKITLIR